MEEIGKTEGRGVDLVAIREPGGHPDYEGATKSEAAEWLWEDSLFRSLGSSDKEEFVYYHYWSVLSESEIRLSEEKHH